MHPELVAKMLKEEFSRDIVEKIRYSNFVDILATFLISFEAFAFYKIHHQNIKLCLIKRNDI